MPELENEQQVVRGREGEGGREGGRVPEWENEQQVVRGREGEGGREREGGREGGKESDPILETCLKSFLLNQPVCPLCPAPHGHIPGTRRYCLCRGVVLCTFPDRLHGRGHIDVKWR